MYDAKKLTDWREKVQKEIDALLEVRSIELMEIIKSEIKVDDKLRVGMGSADICDANGESYTEYYELRALIYGEKDPISLEELGKIPAKLLEFKEEITKMQWNNYFEAGPYTENINC